MKLKLKAISIYKGLGMFGLIAALSSCAVLSDQTSQTAGGPTSAPTPSSSSATRTSQAGQSAIPVLEATSSNEQQALINEINRDGQSLSIPGFREPIPAPVQIEGEDVVELNFEQADLRLILEELAEALDITMVMDPTIDAQISIRTAENRPLAREDIWPLIQLLTRDAGVIIERVGNVYNARRIQSNLAPEIATPETLGQGSAARIMQITPLTYVSAEAATAVIESLLEPEGDVRQITANNTLAITGTESQLVRINQLLLLIDADPFTNQGIHLYQLTNANAIEVAVELDEILQLIEGSLPAYQVR